MRVPRWNHVGLAALLALLAAPPAAAGAPRWLEGLLPQESLAYLSVTDVKGGAAALEGTHLGAIAGELAPFFEELMAGLEPERRELEEAFERQVGVGLWDALAAHGGGLELGLVGIDMERGLPRLALALGTAGREEELGALIGAVKERAGEGPPFEVHGVHVESIGRPPVHVAEVDGHMVATLLADDMRHILDRHHQRAGQQQSIAAPLAHSPDFIAARARTVQDAEALGLLYVNVRAIMRELVLPQLEEDQRAQRGLAALGALDVRSVAVALSVEGARLASRVYVGAPVRGERGGLLGVMAQGPCDRALLELAPESASSLVLARIDMAEAFDRVLAMAERLEPGAREEVEGELEELKQELGVHIRSELLASFGDDLLAVGFPPPGGALPHSVWVIELEEPELALASIERLAGAAGLELASRDMGGRTYRYVLGPLGTLGEDPFEAQAVDPRASMRSAILAVFGQAFTIEGGRLYASAMPHGVADYFDAMAAAGPITKDGAFRRALALVPAGAQALSYSDPRKGFAGGYGLLIHLAKLAEGFGRQLGVAIDVNKLPRAQALLGHLAPGVGSFTLDGDGLTLESRSVLGGTDATMVVVGVSAVVAAIAIPNLLEARKGANESAAIASLRTLVTVQSLYRDTDKDGDDRADFACSLAELHAHGQLIDGVLASGEKQGYRFQLEASDNGYTWRATAAPIVPGETGDRYFYVDDSGVIRYELYFPAGPDSTPIGM